jgi:hypothetical protein
VASVVLLAIAVILFGAFDYLPTPARAAEIFTTVADRDLAIVWSGTLAGLALVWFSGSLFSWLKSHESRSGRLAATAMAGGALAGAGPMAAYGVVYHAAGQAAHAGGLDPSSAWVMYSLYSALMGLVHGLILMIGAVGLVALRTKAFPAWFGWASLVIALGMATPADYIFEGIGMVWIVTVSLWIFTLQGREIPAAAVGG